MIILYNLSSDGRELLKVVIYKDQRWKILRYVCSRDLVFVYEFMAPVYLREETYKRGGKAE